MDVPFERVRPLIGMGADKLMPELIGRYDEALAERKKALFKARYLPQLRAFPRVDGAPEAGAKAYLEAQRPRRAPASPSSACAAAAGPKRTCAPPSPC